MPPMAGDEGQVARLVAGARADAGISQRELARRSGIPGPVVNAIERSRRQPSVPTLAKLLRGLSLELRLEAVGVTESTEHRQPRHKASPAVRTTTMSVRSVSASEVARAHEVYNALSLADHIQRPKRREGSRGVR